MNHPFIFVAAGLLVITAVLSRIQVIKDLPFIQSVHDRMEDPELIRKINGWATVVWLYWFIPAVLDKDLRQSVFLVALYSIYANIASHYTAWVAARAEVRARNVEENTDGVNGEDDG